jgi:hypothetical protein
MFEIGFGIVLYHIITFLFALLIMLLLVPFIANMIDGRGYWYNFKVIWGGVFEVLGHILSLGIRKRN